MAQPLTGPPGAHSRRTPDQHPLQILIRCAPPAGRQGRVKGLAVECHLGARGEGGGVPERLFPVGPDCRAALFADTEWVHSSSRKVSKGEGVWGGKSPGRKQGRGWGAFHSSFSWLSCQTPGQPPLQILRRCLRLSGRKKRKGDHWTGKPARGGFGGGRGEQIRFKSHTPHPFVESETVCFSSSRQHDEVARHCMQLHSLNDMPHPRIA